MVAESTNHRGTVLCIQYHPTGTVSTVQCPRTTHRNSIQPFQTKSTHRTLQQKRDPFKDHSHCTSGRSRRRRASGAVHESSCSGFFILQTARAGPHEGLQGLAGAFSSQTPHLLHRARDRRSQLYMRAPPSTLLQPEVVGEHTTPARSRFGAPYSNEEQRGSVLPQQGVDPGLPPARLRSGGKPHHHHVTRHM